MLHLAAEIASQRSEARVRAVNVEGTRALVEACVAAGSPRVVFTSTVVTGDAGGRLLTEDEPLPVATPYGRSKQDGERLLAESGLPGWSSGPRTSTAPAAGTPRTSSPACGSPGASA